MFSDEEDKMLLQASAYYDNNWQDNGKDIYDYYKELLQQYYEETGIDYEDRDYKRVREHWVQSLDPNANKTPLSREELEELWTLYQRNGTVPWKEWGESHGGRPGMFIMNQLRSYKRIKALEAARQGQQSSRELRRRKPAPDPEPIQMRTDDIIAPVPSPDSEPIEIRTEDLIAPAPSPEQAAEQVDPTPVPVSDQDVQSHEQSQDVHTSPAPPEEEEQSTEQTREEIIQGFIEEIEKLANQLQDLCQRLIYYLSSSN